MFDGCFPAAGAAMREALNLESGLNDGISVAIVVLLLGLAVGTQNRGRKWKRLVSV